MKKIILLFSCILSSTIVSAQVIKFDTAFVIAAKLSLSAQYDKPIPYYDTKKIKDFWVMSYYKEYIFGDSLLFDSNWDNTMFMSIKDPIRTFRKQTMSLEFQNNNDTIKNVNILQSNHTGWKWRLKQHKMVIGDKSGTVVPYTELQRDKIDILLGNNDWSKGVVVAVVCQDYWSEKDQCYKKCDLTNYKKYSPHYYEVCLIFFKDNTAFERYASLYADKQREYHEKK